MAQHGFDRIDTAPEMLLAGIRRHHRMSDAAQSVTAQWNELRDTGLRDMHGRRAFGAYCSMTPDGFEYLTGVEVASFDDLPPDIGRMRLPAQTYAVFRHDGHVSGIGGTWQSIWRDWLPASGYEDAESPPFELYDEQFHPDTGEGGLEIWFPVRERPAQ